MHLYIKWSFPVFLVFFMSCSGDKKPADKNELYKEGSIARKETLTAAHIKIPNSRFYLVPPEGFSIDDLSQQLTKSDGNGYTANFIPMTIYAGTTTEKYIAEVKAVSEKTYPGVWKEETLELSGIPATICRYQAVPGVKMYHLFFRNKWKDQSLIAGYDEKEEPIGEAMKIALKTIIIQ